MIDSDYFLSEIGDVFRWIIQRASNRISWGRQFVVNQTQILLSHGIDGSARREWRTRCEHVCARWGCCGGHITAQTNVNGKNTLTHVQVRHRSAQSGIAQVSPLFFRKEEVSSGDFLSGWTAFAEARKVDWPAECSAEIVVSERSALGFAVRIAAERRIRVSVGDKIVRIQPLVANEFKNRSMKPLTAAAGDDVYLAATTTSRFG